MNPLPILRSTAGVLGAFILVTTLGCASEEDSTGESQQNQTEAQAPAPTVGAVIEGVDGVTSTAPPPNEFSAEEVAFFLDALDRQEVPAWGTTLDCGPALMTFRLFRGREEVGKIDVVMCGEEESDFRTQLTIGDRTAPVKLDFAGLLKDVF